MTTGEPNVDHLATHPATALLLELLHAAARTKPPAEPPMPTRYESLAKREAKRRAIATSEFAEVVALRRRVSNAVLALALLGTLIIKVSISIEDVDAKLTGAAVAAIIVVIGFAFFDVKDLRKATAELTARHRRASELAREQFERDAKALVATGLTGSDLADVVRSAPDPNLLDGLVSEGLAALIEFDEKGTAGRFLSELQSQYFAALRGSPH